MIWSVTGFKHVKYTNKAGRVVEGLSLYVTATDRQDGVEGLETQSLWIPKTVCYEPVLNEYVHIAYNRYGGIEAVERV